MADYNVWADAFDTWQSMADWVKAIAIVMPPVFAMGVLALLLRYRLALRRDRPRPVAFDLLEPQPDDPPASIDNTILEATTDLQYRLEEARRRLMPPNEPARSNQETRKKIEQIILEEYHRKSDPADALSRVRRFLREEGGGQRGRPEVED
ncbi:MULTISPECIES: protein kinase [Rhizobium/Agrobacterium group]|uniref:protein kinase n=1 Tax=Rhizobium/Agrobacterium group TaxID=227290 RepID=UPI000B404E5C|nr:MULTISPECIES: protein kinase [Rhizobium/Agrobacterium group]MCF1482618.1 protein kinase [Allorhizobium ampelinum]NSZ43739.1 protein kinase [Agrobacterium vitis]NTA27486.1 protein kinase [Allorhizobium ampelinum]OVE94538.1 protein kinase [Allorhizobium ampelinum]